MSIYQVLCRFCHHHHHQINALIVSNVGRNTFFDNSSPTPQHVCARKQKWWTKFIGNLFMLRITIMPSMLLINTREMNTFHEFVLIIFFSAFLLLLFRALACVPSQSFWEIWIGKKLTQRNLDSTSNIWLDITVQVLPIHWNEIWEMKTNLQILGTQNLNSKTKIE